MTVREIQGHLQDLYGIEVSPDDQPGDRCRFRGSPRHLGAAGRFGTKAMTKTCSRRAVSPRWSWTRCRRAVSEYRGTRPRLTITRHKGAPPVKSPQRSSTTAGRRDTAI
jgi:hypothetical protein